MDGVANIVAALGQHVPCCAFQAESLRIVFASEAAADLLEVPQAQLQSMPMTQLLDAEDVEAFRASVRRNMCHSAPDESWILRLTSDRQRVVSMRCSGIAGDAGLMLAVLHDEAIESAWDGERVSLRQQIKSKDAKLRLVQELGIGVWKMNLRTEQLLWDDAVFRIYGVSRDEFDPALGGYIDLVHPDDRDEMVRHFELFAASDDIHFQFSHRICLAGGAVAHVRGLAERNRSGDEDWLSGVAQDITAEVHAREKLSEAGRLQRIAGRVARLGGWHVNLHDEVVHWSAETCAIHDLPDGQLLSVDDAIGFYTPPYRDRINAAFELCALNGQPFDEVLQIETHIGRLVWVRSIGEPVHNDSGAIVAVQGAFQDISETVEARNQAEQLARRLMHTLESISDGFFILDHEWRFAFLNRQALQMIGQEKEALLGNICWEVLPRAAIAMARHQFAEAVETGQSIRFQAHNPLRRTWYEVNAHPTSEGLAVYFRDITQSYERDEHLRLLEAAVARQNNIVLITEAAPIDGPEGPRIVFVNDAFTERTGFTREEVVGQTPRLLQGPKTQRTELDRIRQALENKQPVQSELINYTRSGEEFWLELDIVPLADDKGNYTHWVSIERDITERKSAEEAIRRSEERFRLVARATNDVIWDWDLEAGTVWWNENYHSLFGYDLAEVEVGPESWFNHIHDDDRAKIVASIHFAIESDVSTWTHEYRFLHADGHEMTVVDRAFIIRDPHGKAVRLLGSMLDITQKLETESRLNQAQRLEAVGQMTGGVAHDFNNLLSVILGNAEILSMKLDDPELRQLAEMTAAAAERGAELTGQLLAFARKQPLRPILVHAGQLVLGMRGLLRRVLSEAINLDIVGADDLWQTEVDPAQLESGILNLALNSRDAMPEGGFLTIEVANAVLDDARNAVEDDLKPGHYVLISVTDTGHGIPASVKPHVFEPFFTTKGIGKGSGLGLSMVYGFVKQSGGQIRIYSEPGEGTAVKLYFPRAMAAGSSVPKAEQSPQVVGGTESILVVEDDLLVRDYLVAQLATLGYRVASATCGADALALLDTLPDVDLLFTDVVMPGGMNGKELAAAARLRRPGLKVLFTSGYTENAFFHNGRLERGVDLLSKPYRREQLAMKLRKVLDRDEKHL